MRNRSVLFHIVLTVVFVALNSPSLCQETDEAVRPMPPTNLRVFDPDDPDASVQTLNLYFRAYGAGVPQQEREDLQAILREFSDADLQSLAEGLNPKLVGLRRGNALTEGDWKPLVSAYARATLIDRRRSSDRWWEAFLVLVGLALGIFGTLASQYLISKFALTYRQEN